MKVIILLSLLILLVLTSLIFLFGVFKTPEQREQVSVIEEKTPLPEKEEKAYVKELDANLNGQINDDILALWMKAQMNENPKDEYLYRWILAQHGEVESDFTEFDYNKNGMFDIEDFNQLIKYYFPEDVTEFSITFPDGYEMYWNGSYFPRALETRLISFRSTTPS